MIAPAPRSNETTVEHDFTTVLFDLDGTLIDSVGLILESYQLTIREHFQRDLPREHFLAGLGRPLRNEFAEFTEDPEEIDALVAIYRRHNLEHHDTRVTAFPGALDAVHALADRDVTLGIVTSKLAVTAQRGLDVTGYRDVFRVLIGAGDVEQHKPHPEPVLKALEILEVDAKGALYVGDSPHDLVAGRAAGARTAAAMWGPFPREDLLACEPDLILESPTELADLAR